MTAPQMFTLGGNFYTFDQNASGTYRASPATARRSRQPDQFSLDGPIYIINTNVQPNTVVGGGNTYTMTDEHPVRHQRRTVHGHAESRVAQRRHDLRPVQHHPGQRRRYRELRLPARHLERADRRQRHRLPAHHVRLHVLRFRRPSNSYTVTTEPNDNTVTIGNIVYLISNTTVVGDGVTYPILAYRTFADGTPPTTSASTARCRRRRTFACRTTPHLHRRRGHLHANSSPPSTEPLLPDYRDRRPFTSPAAYLHDPHRRGRHRGRPSQDLHRTHRARSSRTRSRSGSRRSPSVAHRPRRLRRHELLRDRQQRVHRHHRPDLHAQGQHRGLRGQQLRDLSQPRHGAYFEVPGGTTYPSTSPSPTPAPRRATSTTFPDLAGALHDPVAVQLTVVGRHGHGRVRHLRHRPGRRSTLTATRGSLTGGYFTDPVTGIVYTCVVDGAVITFIDSNNTVYPFPRRAHRHPSSPQVVVTTGVTLAVDNEATPTTLPHPQQPIHAPAT